MSIDRGQGITITPTLAESYHVGSLVEEAAAARQAALASAGAASNSEDNAATSESNANTSASNASTSASTATTQAGIATTKAGEAVTSASNASTSASNASTSAGDALLQAGIAVASASDAEDALETFEGKYIASIYAPNNPELGDLWFDITNEIVKNYTSLGWTEFVSSLNASSERKSYVTGTSVDEYDGSTTLFPVIYDSTYIDVYMNGIKLTPNDFTATNGTSITLDSEASTGDLIDIIAYGVFQITTGPETFAIEDVTGLQTALDNKVNDGQVLTDVPSSALFSDTVYTPPTAHAISFITGLQTALNAKVDDTQVLTDVPSSALFSDTVYTHLTTAGNKHIPSGGAVGQLLTNTASGTGTWQSAPVSLPAQSSTTSGKRLQSDGSTASWEAVADIPYFNVKDYGAKGDGSTDDTSSINDTITAALNASALTTNWGKELGATVYLPAGKYKVTSSITLKPGIKLLGENKFSTYLVAHGTSSSSYAIINYDQPSISGAGYDLSFNVENLFLTVQDTLKPTGSDWNKSSTANSISGINLEGNPDMTDASGYPNYSYPNVDRLTLIDINNVYGAYLGNTFIRNSWSAGVRIKSCDSTVCKIGFHAEVVGDLDMSNCSAQNSGDTGSYGYLDQGDQHLSYPYAFDEGHRYSNCTTNGTGGGMLVENQDWGSLTGCSFTTCYNNEALKMSSVNNWQISGSQFSPASSSIDGVTLDTYTGYYAGSGSSVSTRHVTFTGCQFSICETGLTSAGQEITLSGCDFRANITHDMNITGERHTVTGNVFEKSAVLNTGATYSTFNGNTVGDTLLLVADGLSIVGNTLSGAYPSGSYVGDLVHFSSCAHSVITGNSVNRNLILNPLSGSGTTAVTSGMGLIVTNNFYGGTIAIAGVAPTLPRAASTGMLIDHNIS